MTTLEKRVRQAEEMYATTLVPCLLAINCPRCGSIGSVYKRKASPLDGNGMRFVLWVAPDGSDAGPPFPYPDHLWHDTWSTEDELMRARAARNVGCGYDSDAWVKRWRR